MTPTTAKISLLFEFFISLSIFIVKTAFPLLMSFRRTHLHHNHLRLLIKSSVTESGTLSDNSYDLIVASFCNDMISQYAKKVMPSRWLSVWCFEDDSLQRHGHSCTLSIDQHCIAILFSFSYLSMEQLRFFVHPGLLDYQLLTTDSILSIRTDSRSMVNNPYPIISLDLPINKSEPEART